MHLCRLSNRKIRHNLLTATRNGITSNLSVQPLDLRALSTSGVSKTTENLDSLSGAELESLGRVQLEGGDGATKTEHGLGLVHVFGLVGDVFEPVVGTLDLAGHVCELEADDGVLEEGLAEGLALVGVAVGFFVADAGEAVALDDDAEALVVEVGHDDFEALVFFANEVLDGDLDVFEGDVGGARGPDAGAVHLAGGDTGHGLFDEEDRNAVHAGVGGASADSNGKVVGPDTVGDPFLLTVDNVVLSIWSLDGGGGQTSDIGSSIRLGDGQTDSLLAVDNTWDDTVLDLLGGGLDDWWETNAETSDNVPDETSGSGTGNLIGEDELVEGIPLLRCDSGALVFGVLGLVTSTDETGEPAALAHILVDLFWNTLGLIPLGDVWLDLLFYPSTNLGTESGVGLVVVWRVVLSIS